MSPRLIVYVLIEAERTFGGQMKDKGIVGVYRSYADADVERHAMRVAKRIGRIEEAELR